MNTNHQTQVLNHLKQGFDIVTHNEPNLNSKGIHARYELNEMQA